MKLPRTASALRRLLPGQGNAWLRSRISACASTIAERRKSATAADLLEAISAQHASRLRPYDLEEIGKALERDLAGAGGAP